MSIVAAAETHGGAAEYGQRHGRLLPQQCPEPAQLGLLRVHRHDPGGETAPLRQAFPVAAEIRARSTVIYLTFSVP